MNLNELIHQFIPEVSTNNIANEVGVPRDIRLPPNHQYCSCHSRHTQDSFGYSDPHRLFPYSDTNTNMA